MRTLRAVLVVMMAVGASGAAYASFCGALIWSGNFHTVEEGQVYRSAQLTGKELAREIELHHIRSVLNLRGPHPSDEWYRDELAATREHGATHYDVGISARKLVAPEKIQEILAILRDAPKPILVHCQSGSDRTGFAAALYRYAIQGRGAQAAEEELSLRYGHFPYLTSQSGAMDESAHDYFSSHPGKGSR